MMILPETGVKCATRGARKSGKEKRSVKIHGNAIKTVEYGACLRRAKLPLDVREGYRLWTVTVGDPDAHRFLGGATIARKPGDERHFIGPARRIENRQLIRSDWRCCKDHIWPELRSKWSGGATAGDGRNITVRKEPDTAIVGAVDTRT